MKRVLLIVVLIGIGVPVFALEFTVAPLYFVDETAERANPRNTFQSRIIDELEHTATGTELRFLSAGTNRYNPPQSVGDAIVVCRGVQASYLIYGFITRREQTIQGELRLLDYEKREVVASFFAMDNNDREEEFITDITKKIFRYIQETYKIGVIAEPESYTHIQIPVSLGYWQPVDANWIDLMFGMVRVEGGIQFIPEDFGFAASGYAHYLSLGLDISYRLGSGREYDALLHGITFTLPVLVHRKLNEQHELYGGLGLLYSFDMLRIKKPYESPELEKYSAAGFMMSGGWSFRLRESIFIFVDVKAELRFYDTLMVSLAPRVGVMLRRYSREVVRKW